MPNMSPRTFKKNSLGKRKRNRSRLQYQKCEERNLLAADFLSPTNHQTLDVSTLATKSNELAIREHLALTLETAWLQKGLNELELVASEPTTNGTTNIFQQTWNGLRVHDSFVTVVQDADGNITAVRDRARQNIRGYAQDTATIGIEEATIIGSSGFGDQVSTTSDSTLAWYYAGNKARLAWLVETTAFDSRGQVSNQFSTWVNVFNGKIFNRETQGSYIEELIATPIESPEVNPRIVINDAIGATGSQEYAAPFDSVVAISVGCTGALIAPDAVITARHCGIGTGDFVFFGDNSNSPDLTVGISSVLDPAGGGTLLDGGDVTILTLSESVPASVATPMRFIDAAEDLIGMTAVTAGYGWNGVGSTGHQFTADGLRWAGQNVIDAVGTPASAFGSNIISTDFDDGSANNNTIGTSSSTPLTLEATTAPGDSGGPILVDVGGEWVIAGVLSGGTDGNSFYGDISWWTGTTIYRSEIENAGGEFIEAGVGIVNFSQDNYFIGDTIAVNIVDPNATGDIQVTVTSDTGDEENVTVSPDANGNYLFTLESAFANTRFNDGTLQVTADDQIQVTYIDADDGSGNSAELTDTAMMLEVEQSDSPTAVGDTGTTNEDESVNLNITANDFDPNGDEISLDMVNAPANGTAVINPNGTVDYTPNADFFGTDIFTYEISDPAGNTATGTVSVTVVSVNDAPTGVSLSSNLIEESADTNNSVFVGTLTGIDVDHLVHSFELVEGSGDVDNDLFEISGDSLNLKAGSNIDFDAKPQYSIRVSANDGEFAVESTLVIDVVEEAMPVAVSIADGLDQRSMITDAVITFDQIVNVQDGAFELVKRGADGGNVDVTPIVDNRSGVTVVTLSFSGQFVSSSSLTDGNYQLTIRSNLITTLSGDNLDGDGDGMAGGDFVFGDQERDNFFRLFGDNNGDRVVSTLDLLNFHKTYLDTTADASFNANYDFNLDGRISTFDLLQFHKNYLRRLDFA